MTKAVFFDYDGVLTRDKTGSHDAANLAAPAALGMTTVHLDDEKNDIAGLKRVLRKHVSCFV